jgi:hypothetical protein
MVFQLSAGVNFSEIDITTIVPGVGTTEGALAGSFAWGPVKEVRTISSEVELVNTFGKPDANTFTDFFTAANFLTYGQNLKIVRTTGTSSLLNATAQTAGVLIENETDYQQNHSSGANTTGAWAAKWPSVLGNSLKVSMYASPNTANFSTWVYNGYFDRAPGTSNWANNQSAINDEMHVAIIDEDGKFSGTQNTVLERFSNLSKASDAKRDDGGSNYYKDVINDQSKYIWWLAHPDVGIGLAAANSQANNWGSEAAGVTFGSAGNVAYTISLTNGSYNTSTDAETTAGYDFFKNAEETDISLVMTSDHSDTVIDHVLDNIVEFRKDCMAFASPLKASVVDNAGSEAAACVTDRDSHSVSSYGFMDCNWKYQFDKYNNTYRWVPLNGDIAGLCVRTDFERDAWFSPAGFNRGQIRNVTKLAWNPNKTERDTLYKNGINPVLNFPGEGTILYGDKTMLNRPSAFDRINVRRLFIILEKAIARAARFSLFEFNDSFTRAQFVSLVEPFLRDIQGRRGIFDFRVVADETNNTAEVIDRNEFVGDIYIKPARSINFIQLNFVAVRTGVSFDEIVGQF